MSEDLLLPDGDLDPTLLAFTRNIRTFAAEKLEPHARRVDEEGTFRHPMVQELAEAGILGGPIGKEHGGQGWSAMQLALAHEEIGAVCGNARGFLAVQTGLVAHCIERFGNQATKQRWLPALVSGSAIGCFALTEEEAGSDVASLQCSAVPGEGGYTVIGRKIWISNGGIADVIVLFATIDQGLGKDGITAFILEANRPGIGRLPMPGKELGHRGSDHAQLVFNNVPASEQDILGTRGQGFGVAMRGLTAGRLSVAAGAVGIHRAAVLAALQFTRSRKQFGKSIASFQMVQERLADMTAELLAARALVHRCARRRDEGRETVADLAVAKMYATEAASRAADQCLMLHGGRGYTSAFPAERLLRDSLALRIYEGTTMIQKLILARALQQP